LAVLDVNRANGLQELYPDITKWYIGGHSLGGSMAASYLSNNIDSFDGLILLGSYSTEDFSNTNINVLSIYGSEDKVMNKEKYNEYKNNIDDNLKEVVIDGGNHAYYGMYGNQDGDGKAIISNRNQIEITTETIMNFIK
jgi:pimeloyl-ACP methyl ester carboxylesterase